MQDTVLLDFDNFVVVSFSVIARKKTKECVVDSSRLNSFKMHENAKFYT